MGRGVIVAFLVGLFATQVHAAAPLRQCRQAIDDPVNQDVPDGDEVAAHRLFPWTSVDPTVVAANHYVMVFRLVVDARGRPMCTWGAWPSGGYDTAAAEQQGQALRRQAATWRYKPFLSNGKPVSTMVEDYASVDATASEPRAMPVGPLFSSEVSLKRTGCFGRCPNYTVTLHGDGRVEFTGGQYADVQGRHHWTISPGEVAALIERFRSAGIWTAHDNYVWAATDQPTYELRVTIGGKSRRIHDYGGQHVGMPESVTAAENDVDQVSGAEGLITLNTNAVRLLKSESFDFKSATGADLLTRALADAAVDDTTIMMLLDQGTPLHGGHEADQIIDMGQPPKPVSALDSAMMMGRETLARHMIEMGALDLDGQSHAALVNNAFQNAIRSGRLSLVEMMWDYHPALVFDQSDTDEDGQTVHKTLPVTMLLDRDGAENDAWQDFAIARFLLAKGCDINAKNIKGNSLLHMAAEDGNKDYVSWLLAQGSDVRVLNSDNESALNKAYDEDIALVLLDAGADPTVEPMLELNFLYAVQDDHWTRAIDWLKAHGYTNQLAANAPDAKTPAAQ